MAYSTITLTRHKYKYRVIGDYDNDNGTKVYNKATLILDDGRKIGSNLRIALTDTGGVDVDENTIKDIELYKTASYPAGKGTGRKVVLIYKDLNTSMLRDVDYDITTVAGS